MMSDPTVPVRDPLDLEALGAWLAAHGFVGELEAEQFPGGFSNLTYLLRVGEQTVVLRRPPVGAHVKSGHDMEREFAVLRALHGPYGKVPRPLIACDDASVIGAPFYVMERVRGTIVRDAAAVQDAAAQSAALVDTLAELHALDRRSLGLELGHPQGYVARQVQGWTRRYVAARTDDVPAIERVATWLEANRPTERAAALIHNDFKYDNVVFDPAEPARVVAVLDWEMSTIGDPLMDLGTTLGYWLEANDPEELRALLPNATTAPGGLSRADVLQRYASRSGRDVGDGVFHYAFGLFKIAVIMQQIYARHRQGLTSDPRFASLGDAVAACAGAAAAAIDRGSV
jgi:aminoglycoside phosphotransferase (APT) family kinase protein